MIDSFGPEISDVIVDYDSDTLGRKPVKRDKAIEILEAVGNRRAADIVRCIPHRDGVLNGDAVDRLLLRSHYELQRISELMGHGRRVFDILQTIAATLAADGVETVRIVDVGCGTGFVVRWLAACSTFQGKVELIGVDYNAAFIQEARRLAEMENLPCRFEVANGFTLDTPANILTSTGVLHHFRGAMLKEFFAQHGRGEAQAFAHFDFQPTPATPFGSWLFHEILMREPLARHDGVLSALRAHKAEVILSSAVEALPAYRCAIYGAQFWMLPVPRVLHCVVGLKPHLCSAFKTNLGVRASMLGEFR